MIAYFYFSTSPPKHVTFLLSDWEYMETAGDLETTMFGDTRFVEYVDFDQAEISNSTLRIFRLINWAPVVSFKQENSTYYLILENQMSGSKIELLPPYHELPTQLDSEMVYSNTITGNMNLKLDNNLGNYGTILTSDISLFHWVTSCYNSYEFHRNTINPTGREVLSYGTKCSQAEISERPNGYGFMLNPAKPFMFITKLSQQVTDINSGFIPEPNVLYLMVIEPNPQSEFFDSHILREPTLVLRPNNESESTGSFSAAIDEKYIESDVNFYIGTRRRGTILIYGAQGKLSVGLNTYTTDELSELVVQPFTYDEGIYWGRRTYRDERGNDSPFLSYSNFAKSVSINNVELVKSRWQESPSEIQAAILTLFFTSLGYIFLAFINALTRKEPRRFTEPIHAPVITATPLSPTTIRNIASSNEKSKPSTMVLYLVLSLLLIVLLPKLYRKYINTSRK